MNFHILENMKIENCHAESFPIDNVGTQELSQVDGNKFMG